jgi:hypothetical protein
LKLLLRGHFRTAVLKFLKQTDAKSLVVRWSYNGDDESRTP